MGLPSLLHMLRARRSRDPSPALWGKDVSGSDFRLSSSEIVGNTSQSRQDEVVCLLTAASVPGHQSQVLPSSAVFLINEGLCSWILFFKTKY